MVENVFADRIEHKVDRVFKTDLIKVYYRCAHCNKEHSHGANNGDLHTGFIHRASHCPITKAPLTADNRCMARVWGSGSGNDQCKCARGEDTDYCSRHAKQAAICEEPCHLDENGKKKGLFCGRIDQFHGNTDLAPFMVGGEIRIEWNSLPMVRWLEMM
eukprot:SAG22_NODE_5987_length_920_cov_2.576127_2_plen_159_part_00